MAKYTAIIRADFEVEFEDDGEMELASQAIDAAHMEISIPSNALFDLQVIELTPGENHG